MIPTFIGAAVTVVALILLVRASAPAMFMLLILCGLFAGSAAIALPALGGSSIPPMTFCLGFLVLRLILPGSGLTPLLRQGLRANIFLIVFAIYGIVMAFAGPRLFGADIEVVPMRSEDTKIWATYPLVFSTQNITASFYLFATSMFAASAYAVCRLSDGANALVRAAIWLASVHMAFGIIGVLFANTPVTEAMALLRNGNYAQLDQSVAGYVRMTGIMPEPSAFAGYGFIWGVFLIECWYRDVQPSRTGPIGLAMMLVLLASTSSTAYVSVAAYALIFIARIILVPDAIRPDKILILSVAGAASTGITTALLLSEPKLIDALVKLVSDLTVHKQNSLSGLQRAFWAKQGLYAFTASSGLGIGPGSFRSSSIVTAVLGATGIVGATSMVCYLIAVLKPLRSTTYHRVVSRSDAIGTSAAWAALCLLIPAAVASPTADPGPDFGTLAGASLALRLRRRSAMAEEVATLDLGQSEMLGGADARQAVDDADIEIAPPAKVSSAHA